MIDGSYKSRGIVLHTMAHGENGHIVFMLTEAYGRVSYYVNSGRRGVAVVGGSKVMLHQLTVIDFVGAKGKGSFHRIKEASRAIMTNNMLTDVYKSTISMYMSELIYKVVKDEEANPMLFDFLFHSIKMLDAIEEGKSNFHLYFTLQLTKYLGFYPENNFEEDFYFDMKSGGFVMIRPTHLSHLERDESILLWRLMHLSSSTLDTFSCNGRKRTELLTKIVDYISLHHEANYRIKSLEYMQEIF